MGYTVPSRRGDWGVATWRRQRPTNIRGRMPRHLVPGSRCSDTKCQPDSLRLRQTSRTDSITKCTQVIVVVGDPINFDDLIVDSSDDTQHISRGILYDKATQRIGQRLQELKAVVDRLAAEQQSEVQNYYVHDTVDDGYRLWQQVDWEAFGIGSSMLSSEPSSVQEPPKQAEPEPHLEEQSISPVPSAAISL